MATLRWTTVLGWCAAAFAALFAGNARSAEMDGCYDSGLLSQGKIISSFCYECFFPINIMGIVIPVGRGESKSPPSSELAAPLCICPGRYGIPAIGLSFGMWHPNHLHEVVKTPLCSPVVLGMNLGGTNASNPMGLLKAQQLGGSSGDQGTGSEDSAFYNWHWIKFPGAYLTDLLTNTICAPQGSSDMDFGYISEIDPTMQNDTLAAYTHPEARIFTQMAAQAACLADTVKVAVGRPLHKAFWCAGSWGSVYPYTGHSMPQTTFESQMLTAARGLAAMHRRGLAKKTIGNGSVCGGRFWFILPREQYQFQNLWPRAVQGAEWIGTTEYKGRWGMTRVVPATGENRVIMEWQHKQCCLTAW